MASSDRKNIALIIAGMKPKKGGDEGEDSYDDTGLHTIAEELLRAIKRGDVDDVVDSLCSFIDTHKSSPANDNDNDEDDDSDY